jgi:CHASE2 domain-containing sensor protein
LVGLAVSAQILVLGWAVLLAGLLIELALFVRPTSRNALRASVALAAVMVVGYLALAVGQLVDRGPFLLSTVLMTVISVGLVYVSVRLLSGLGSSTRTETTEAVR